MEVTGALQMQQMQTSMLTAALQQQQAAIQSINSATQTADLSFMGIGQNINIQA